MTQPNTPTPDNLPDKMTATPRTDPVTTIDELGVESCDASFARQLERELAAANSELAAAREDIAAANLDYKSLLAREASTFADLAKLREEKLQFESVMDAQIQEYNELDDKNNVLLQENAALRADLKAHEEINKQLIEDKRRLDWLEATLVSLHRLSTPDMDGTRVTAQLRNKLRDDAGAAGPSCVRVGGSTVRGLLDAAREGRQ